MHFSVEAASMADPQRRRANRRALANANMVFTCDCSSMRLGIALAAARKRERLQSSFRKPSISLALSRSLFPALPPTLPPRSRRIFRVVPRPFATVLFPPIFPFLSSLSLSLSLSRSLARRHVKKLSDGVRFLSRPLVRARTRLSPRALLFICGALCTAFIAPRLNEFNLFLPDMLAIAPFDGDHDGLSMFHDEKLINALPASIRTYVCAGSSGETLDREPRSSAARAGI